MKDRILKINEELNGQKYIFWALVAMMIFMVLLYAYLINKTVMNVVLRGKMEKQVSSLEVKVGEMEYKYISLKNGINIDLAYSLGYKNVSDPQYISAKTLGRSVSVNTIQ